MWGYLKIELSKFFTNKKNIAVYVLLLSFAVFYAIRIAPAYDPIEKVDINQIEANYLTREEFLIQREGKDSSSSHPAVQYAMSIFPLWNEIELKRMEALQKKDLKEYTLTTSEWYLFTDSQTFGGGYYYYNPRYYTFGNNDAHMEGHLAYLATASKYAKYAEFKNQELSLEVLEEFTAIQTLYRLMDDYLPYVLLVACLLLSVDVVLQDRKHPTLLRGYPIHDWKKLITKGITAFIGSLAIFVPLLIGYIIIGIQFGFGSFKFPVAIRLADNPHGFETITMAKYFALTGTLLLAWFIVIISFVLLLSVILRNEIANLIGGLMLVFAEFYYLDKGYGYFKPVQDYLPTYTQVSHVVTNSKNYFYEASGIDFSKGLLLLSISAVILIILSVVITLSKRYRFIR